METSILEFGNNVFNDGLITFAIKSFIIYILCVNLVKVIRKGFKIGVDKGNFDELHLRYMMRIIKVIIYTLMVMVILSGVKMFNGLGKAALGATSVASVIVGLAAQESFGNFIAGFFLTLSHPFQVGDFINIPEKGISGTVSEITFRHTILKTIENSMVIVPNATMNTAIIENKVQGNGIYTRWISFSIGYDSDIELAKKLIKEAVLSCDKVVKSVDVVIRVDDFLDSGIMLNFCLNTVDFSSSYLVASEVRIKLLKMFKENNIEIPYNKIEIVK